MDSSFLHGLPNADSRFTAIKGTGPAAHNLETSLHRATLTSSNPLHAIQPHIQTVAKIFNNAYVKSAIRNGGLGAGAQKSVYNKIVNEIHKTDSTIIGNSHKKELIKNIVKHFGSEKTKPKIIIRRALDRAPEAQHAATSVRDLVNKNSPSSGYSTGRPAGTVGSISDLIGSRHNPPPPSPSSNPYHPPIHLSF